jgi:hypothetical protein
MRYTYVTRFVRYNVLTLYEIQRMAVHRGLSTLTRTRLVFCSDPGGRQKFRHRPCSEQPLHLPVHQKHIASYLFPTSDGAPGRPRTMNAAICRQDSVIYSSTLHIHTANRNCKPQRTRQINEAQTATANRNCKPQRDKRGHAGPPNC